MKCELCGKEMGGEVGVPVGVWGIRNSDFYPEGGIHLECLKLVYQKVTT